MYEGRCVNKSKRIDLFGIGAAGSLFFFADKSFSNRVVGGRPGVLSLWLLSFINREFAMLILNDLKGNAQFVQKVTFELLMNFKQNHYGS